MNLMSGNICKFLWVMIFFCFVGSGHAAQSLMGQGNVSLQVGDGVSDNELRNIGNERYEMSFSTVNEANINSSDVFFCGTGVDQLEWLSGNICSCGKLQRCCSTGRDRH